MLLEQVPLLWGGGGIAAQPLNWVYKTLQSVLLDS